MKNNKIAIAINTTAPTGTNIAINNIGDPDDDCVDFAIDSSTHSLGAVWLHTKPLSTSQLLHPSPIKIFFNNKKQENI